MNWTDHYEIQHILNHGGTSTVYQVKDKDTHQEFAMKLTPFAHLSKTVWDNEIKVLKQFQYNRGIIKMWEYGANEEQGYVILELCQSDLCDEPVQIHEQTPVFLFLLRTIQHLHEQGLCFNDLKLENILRQGQGYRLCDFSSCLPIGTRSQTLYGTPSVMAPELIQAFHHHQTYYYDEKIDVWGFGCVMFEIITQKPLFDIPSDWTTTQILHTVSHQTIDWSSIVSPSLRLLLQQCLSPDPRLRPRIWDIRRIVDRDPSLFAARIDGRNRRDDSWDK
jgi:serine/threonine protein kinase